MRETTKQKLTKEEEAEALESLITTKLEALLTEFDFFQQLAGKLDQVEADRIVLGCLYELAASQAVAYGQSREDFLKSLGDVFDAIAEDDPSDDEPLIPLPIISLSEAPK